MSCKISRQDLRIAECLVHLSGHSLRSKSRKGERARHRATSAMQARNKSNRVFQGCRPRFASLPCTNGNENHCTIQPDNILRNRRAGEWRVSRLRGQRREQRRRRIVLAKPIAPEYESHFSYFLIARALRIPAYRFEIVKKKQLKSFLQIC